MSQKRYMLVLVNDLFRKCFDLQESIVDMFEESKEKSSDLEQISSVLQETVNSSLGMVAIRYCTLEKLKAYLLEIKELSGKIKNHSERIIVNSDPFNDRLTKKIKELFNLTNPDKLEEILFLLEGDLVGEINDLPYTEED